MGDGTKIEWTDATWNPVTGCTKISPGCHNCYAERISNRFGRSFNVKIHPDRIEVPSRWKKPRLVFVCSMGDLLHDDVPLSFIRQVVDVTESLPRHTFQVLTKRPERLTQIDRWPPNVWVGVSVERSDYLWRLDLLRKVQAATRFVSFEPLLGRINGLRLDGIDWVIVGGESGPGSRRMSGDWAREIRNKCVGAGVPFFFKQWGGSHKGRKNILDGKNWAQKPALP